MRLGAAVAAAVLLAARPGARAGLVAVERLRTRAARRYRRSPFTATAPTRRSRRPAIASPPAANWSTKNPICLQLEQRLVQEGQRGNHARDALPQLEAEIHQTDQALQARRAELERRHCYEYFLFSKTLRRTRACVDLAKQEEQAKRRLSDLETQRQQIIGSSERSYRDDIVRELARNNCGANYTQEARRQNRGGIFSIIWQDEEGGELLQQLVALRQRRCPRPPTAPSACGCATATIFR